MQKFASALRQPLRTVGRAPHSTRFNSTTTASGQPSWSEYFAQRKRRRYFQTVRSDYSNCCNRILGRLGVLWVSASGCYETSYGASAHSPHLCSFSSTHPQGIDPLLFYGGCVILCGGAGWVVGPSVGGSIWRVFHRQSVAQIDALDREFFKHVARNRVDATLQSATNPIPDYYGEKVGSLAQYRQWLRDQNKYRRKAAPLREE
ncbi:hypothetical protein HMN09_00871700 [Mycena chlorophos]|uniref:Presequence translocated-associated motor subunit PAM17 n=1 Tax=Mycena chlorophos TaxID=658473 RepID=A0A8H6SR25_MYCCL|nr:hypothetical protein HMN09_00871700 [Mycena chlorophos]